MSRMNAKKIHTYISGRSRITTGPLYIFSMYGIRVPDDGTVTFYREIKFKMRFGVVHCCYYDKIYLQLIDMRGLRLQRAIYFNRLILYSNGSRCKILTASLCKNKRNI